MNRTLRTLATSWAVALPLCGLLLGSAATAQAPLTFDWEDRDLEGRWVAVAGMLRDADTKGQEALATRLAQGGDHELLEMLALARGWEPWGKALLQADSPHWVRTTVWLTRSTDSHNMDGAASAVKQHRQLVLAWLQRFPAGGNPIVEKVLEVPSSNQKPPMGGAAEDAAVARQLPPLDPAAVSLRWLHVRGELPFFGERKTAEPGVVYVHQVTRAITTLCQCNWVGPAETSVLVRLMSHPQQVIRDAVVAGMARLQPAVVPWQALLRVVDGPRGGPEATPLRDRNLAVVALARSGHPAAWLRVHDVAADPDHPARANALRTLERVGNEASLVLLSAMMTQETSSGGPALHLQDIQDAMTAIGERLAAGEGSASLAPSWATLLALWAHRAEHRAAVALRTSALATFQALETQGQIAHDGRLTSALGDRRVFTEQEAKDLLEIWNRWRVALEDGAEGGGTGDGR